MIDAVDATSGDGRPSARTVWIECAVMAAVVFVGYAASRPNAVATLGRLYDDVVYLSVGKSIADGHGYRSAQLVGTPVHVKFPPLLPAVYAVGWRVFGSLGAVASMALWLNIIVASASAGALWWLARRELGLGRITTTLFPIVPIVTDRTMFYFSGAASEPWMLLGWTVSLILVMRLTRQAPETMATGTAVLLGLILAATALSRTQGWVIAAVVLAGVALSRVGWRTTCVVAAATAAPLVVWSVWHGAMMARGPLSPLPDQRGYLAWIPMGGVGAFASFAVRMIRISAPLYWSSAADVLVGWVSSKTLVLAAALLLAGFVGTAMLARIQPAMTASIVATLGVLAIWPYVQDRFLTPVLPVLGVAGAFAVERTLVRTPALVRRGALGIAALVCVALVFENTRTRIASARGAPDSPYARAIDDIVRWIDANTAPDDRIMVSWGGAIYLRTGRRTSIPNPEEPTLGASVLDAPYRFYSTRLLADSVDDVILWDRAPGRAATWLRALAARCPGVLTETKPDSTAARALNDVHFYRVRRDLPCLEQTARAAVTDNKNAP